MRKRGSKIRKNMENGWLDECWRLLDSSRWLAEWLSIHWKDHKLGPNYHVNYVRKIIWCIPEVTQWTPLSSPKVTNYLNTKHQLLMQTRRWHRHSAHCRIHSVESIKLAECQRSLRVKTKLWKGHYAMKMHIQCIAYPVDKHNRARWVYFEGYSFVKTFGKI